MLFNRGYSSAIGNEGEQKIEIDGTEKYKVKQSRLSLTMIFIQILQSGERFDT